MEIFYIYKACKYWEKVPCLQEFLNDLRAYHSNTKQLPPRQDEYTRIIAGSELYRVYKNYRGVHIQ